MLVGSALTTPLHTLFQSLGHTPDGGSNHLQRNLVPNLPQLCLQLLNVLDALHFTNFAVEVRPHIFNWIEVRALRGMILDAIRSNFIEELDGFFGGVLTSIEVRPHIFNWIGFFSDELKPFSLSSRG